MKRLAIVATILVTMALTSAGIADATITGWGNATAIPGMTTIATGGASATGAVACIDSSICVIAGSYAPAVGQQQVFSSQLVAGSLANATEAPSITALNTGNLADVAAVSCTPTPNCAVIGTFRDTPSTGSLWVSGGNAGPIEIPGIGAFNITHQNYGAGGVSCWSDNNCAAVGEVTDTMHRPQTIVVEMINGVWGNAMAIGGITTAGSSKGSISCWGAGECVVTGQFVDTNIAGYTAFIAERSGGTWGAPFVVPGMSTLTGGTGSSFSNAVSCSSDGTCTIGGSYNDATLHSAWLAERTGGTWGNAVALPGLNSVTGLQGASIDSISCWSSSDCTAVGRTQISGALAGMMLNRVGGSWLASSPVPGLDTLDVGHQSIATVISCATNGMCATTGTYTDASSNTQGWVLLRINGVWQMAEATPGLEALATGGYVESTTVSCSTTNCMVGGQYQGTAPVPWGAWVASLAITPDPTTTTTSTSTTVPDTTTTAAGDPVVPAFTG